MEKIKNGKLTVLSQQLRTNMTREEKHLWYDFLKKQHFTVHRQKVIGDYIADFYCAECGIVIELDGSQHWKTENKQSDSVRDEYLKSLGLKVLRYSNHELNTNFEGVCANILTYLTPHPSADG